MTSLRSSSSAKRRASSAVWIATALLVVIGIAAVALRFYKLFAPSEPSSHLAASASLDAYFLGHRTITVTHIVAASLFLALMPFQFIKRLRDRNIALHRWSGHLLLVIGCVMGLTALIMTFTMNIGGVSETSATTFFAILFLLFLGLGFLNIRRHRVDLHRQWMLRAFGVALGAATTRPIVGAFFAGRRLSPHEFFGTAFWLGFTATLLAAEAWIHYTEKDVY